MINLRKGIFLTLISMIFLLKAKAQEEDLLKLVEEDKPQKEIVKNAFKATRIINTQSMEFLAPGTMDFTILHRFGQLDRGVNNLFGLDEASMRMAFDFGITKNLMIGVGRSTYKKELDAFFKYAPVRQSAGSSAFPVTIALASGLTLNTLPWQDPVRQNYFTSRMAFFSQVIIGRKFSEVLSLQLTPTMIHYNLVPTVDTSNDIYALGIGGRYKLAKRFSFNWDYSYVINSLDKNVYTNPLSVGIDIETGGHVFQLHFSNSTGMNERAFVTETSGHWDKTEVRFGFNLSRIFQIKKRKED